MNNIDNARKKWNKQKLMGKRKYILIHGGLPWGVGALVYSILTIFMNPNPRNYEITGILSRGIWYGIIFGLCGVLVGFIKWNSKVSKFDYQ